MLYELLKIAFPEERRPPLDMEVYRKIRLIGKALLFVFVLSLVLYKFFLPNNYLFLFSWATSTFGFPMYFISVLDMFYLSRGMEVSYGKWDASTLPKFLNLFFGILALLSGVFLPILIKLYL